jgi:hypothetical protein
MQVLTVFINCSVYVNSSIIFSFSFNFLYFNMNIDNVPCFHREMLLNINTFKYKKLTNIVHKLTAIITYLELYIF